VNWTAFGVVVEALGVLAIVATLAYLAMQTKMNSRLLAIQAPQWLHEGSREWLAGLRTDAEFTRIVRYAVNYWSALDLNQQMRVHGFFAEMMIHLDVVMELREQDVIKQVPADGWIDNALGMLTTSGGREWWVGAKFLFNSETVAFLDDRLSDTSSLPKSWTDAPFWQVEPSDHEYFSKQVAVDPA
jgi:hypothetical protein